CADGQAGDAPGGTGIDRSRTRAARLTNRRDRASDQGAVRRHVIDHKREEAATMKLAIQTLLLPGEGIAEQFANAARYGFDAVEVAVGSGFDLGERFDEVRRASESAGLPVCAICTHPIHDPLVPDPTDRARRFAALASLLRLADDLGARGVVSVPVRPPHAFPE